MTKGYETSPSFVLIRWPTHRMYVSEAVVWFCTWTATRDSLSFCNPRVPLFVDSENSSDESRSADGSQSAVLFRSPPIAPSLGALRLAPDRAISRRGRVPLAAQTRLARTMAPLTLTVRTPTLLRLPVPPVRLAVTLATPRWAAVLRTILMTPITLAANHHCLPAPLAQIPPTHLRHDTDPRERAGPGGDTAPYCCSSRVPETGSPGAASEPTFSPIADAASLSSGPILNPSEPQRQSRYPTPSRAPSRHRHTPAHAQRPQQRPVRSAAGSPRPPAPGTTASAPRHAPGTTPATSRRYETPIGQAMGKRPAQPPGAAQ